MESMNAKRKSLFSSNWINSLANEKSTILKHMTLNWLIYLFDNIWRNLFFLHHGFVNVVVTRFVEI